MARYLKHDRTRPRSAANQTAFQDFIAPEEEDKKRRPKPKRDFMQLLSETNQLKETQDWEVFRPKHFVALYCLLHKHVYGVVPDEVRSHFQFVVGAAMRMLKHEFDGKRSAMVDFMRWVWAREMKRLKHREPENDFRIGWRLQFGPKLLVDYRVAIARKGKRVQ